MPLASPSFRRVRYANDSPDRLLRSRMTRWGIDGINFKPKKRSREFFTATLSLWFVKIRLRVLTASHQAKIKFGRAAKGFDSNALVVSVDRGALFARQIHCRKAVDSVGYSAVVTGVGALYHKVRRNDTAAPR